MPNLALAEAVAVVAHDACRVLPAVLKHQQSLVNLHSRAAAVLEYAEDAAVHHAQAGPRAGASVRGGSKGGNKQHNTNASSPTQSGGSRTCAMYQPAGVPQRRAIRARARPQHRPSASEPSATNAAAEPQPRQTREVQPPYAQRRGGVSPTGGCPRVAASHTVASQRHTGGSALSTSLQAAARLAGSAGSP